MQNAAWTAPFCGIVWAEKVLGAMDRMDWSLGPI
jgi:hypothetical protein